MGENESSRPALAGVSVGSSGELSRGDVILKGALGAAALYGLNAVTPYVRAALAAEEGDDLAVLNYLLPFEYLQLSIYNRGESERNDYNEKMSLEGKKQLVETLHAEEGEHIEALKKLIADLGGKPVKIGEYAFAFRELQVFFTMSAEIEGFAIGAYNGAISSLESREARELTSSIVQVEGRHAAALLIAAKEDPAPKAFDHPESEDNSINAVGKFTGVFS